MKSNFFPKYRRLTVILIIVLNGCATPPSVVKQNNFEDLARRTFSSGIRYISERYIDPIQVSELAIEGLRGLENIDENLKIEVTPSTVILNFSKILSHEFIKPTSGNLQSWSEKMASALKFARSNSSSIGNANQEVIFTAMFDGSVSLLDAFSHYSGSEQASLNRAKRSGFGGIGVVIKTEKEEAIVISVIEYSPAFILGIKVGDIITHVGNASIKGWQEKTITNSIRGKIGTFIDIKLRRNKNSNFKYSIKRAKIIPPTVRLKHSNGILHVNVSDFNNGTALEITSKVRTAIKIADNLIYGMILDLRGNSGGVFSQAIKVVDLFLEDGKILTTKGRHPASQQEYRATENDILAGKPLIVLINGASASSSEIVAAALQDHNRSIVVGTSSFGKGSVQSVGQLPNGGELTLTWSRFVTPSGYILHNLGVPPNICTFGEETYNDIVVADTLNKAKPFNQLKIEWQEVEPNDTRRRTALRKICQPSKKEKNVDILIAEKLILDTSLYNRVR